MKKRFIIVLFLALLMLTVLAACGEKEGTFPGGMSNVTTGTPTVGTQPGTQDTTAPTTQAPTQGATESTTPPATESTTPPATESTTPPATEPTTPPATEPTTPPATEPTTPPATDPTTPPATESTTPPVTEPPATNPPTTTPPTTTPPTTTPPATEAPHAHNFISTVTTAATCGKDGVRTYSCSCGDTYTEKIAATGHKPVEVKGFSPTASSPGLTVGQKCETCQEVLVEQEVIPAGDPGYITSKPIVITTEHLEFHIPAGVFVPNNLVENANIITNAIETVTGLRFAGNPEYGGGKVPVNISRYSGDPNSESGSAYTYYGSVYMCPVDLIDYMALIHECSHVIEGRQHGWSYAQIATEGISTYTEYKVSAYIAQNYPDLLQYARVPERTFYNYELSYEALYAHPVEYWFENILAESSNANYSIGLRLMRYLETVYGSYTKWFLDYHQYNPYKSELYGGQMLPVEEQLKAFKLAYGDDVFDNFYPWLQQNEAWFADPSRTDELLDLTAIKTVNPYPIWKNDTSHDCELAGFCFRVEYEDLSVGLDALRYYIETYKGKSADGLCLNTMFDGTLYFYDAQGNLLREETSSELWSPRTFNLSGVSVIKLGGKVNVWRFQLEGF